MTFEFYHNIGYFSIEKSRTLRQNNSMSKVNKKKIIPFRKAFGIFILWGVLLAVLGYLSYIYIFKPYIIDRPYIIEIEKPIEDKK